MQIYDTLLSHYGDPHWWPAQTPFEVIVGAVLTQNTAWGNVEKAIANFNDLSPQLIESMSITKLVDIIRPAGFFNQKAVYLKAVTKWFARYGYRVANVKAQPLQTLRTELLATKGIGAETADSILLYAFDMSTFVIDAYTNRLCERFPIKAGKGYNAVKAYFETGVPKNAAVYNKYHALIVINAKTHCKKTPQCDGCPLSLSCAKQYQM